MRVAMPGGRTFFFVRVSVLLTVLFVVALYAVRDVWSRRSRTDWDHTLDVAIVLVHVDGERPVEADAVAALRERVGTLELRLGDELRRHRPAAPTPFRFRVFGPVDARTRPPPPPAGGLVELVQHAWDTSRWCADVDPRAELVPSHWDTRIYVAARRPARDGTTMVEGASESGGRVGFVDVELDASMVDLTLFVVAHELFHTLGATDKYDATGRVRAPEGLVAPEASPLYPQRFADVMARNRPVSPSAERVPETLDELGVGPATAAEIRWLP